MNMLHVQQRGFSLVELIVVAAISTLIFGVLFASFNFSIQLLTNSRAKLSALSIANDRLEYIRSLPYDAVGTIAGIPPGLIPQNSTTTLNGIIFSERVLIEYVDDPADGSDTATTSDSNGISADYKRVKVEYTWTIASSTDTLSMVTNIVPRSIETTVGGGTVRINVINQDSEPLPGASVRLINTTGTSSIDVTRFTDSTGTVLISGAPANSNYEVIVTALIGGRQYSISQTYAPTTLVPNPVLGPFTVLEADISTLTFQIGELSDITIATKSTLNEDSVLEDFSSLTNVPVTNNVVSSGGALVLSGTPGSYPANGSAFLTAITPPGLVSWEVVRLASDLPANTNFTIQFFTDDGLGNFTVIPDSDLPGNSSGFTDTLIDVSTLDTGAYPSIVPGLILSTTNAAMTPRILEMETFYRTGVTNLPGVATTLRGTKQIGTDAGGSPVYKFSRTVTTNGSGEVAIQDVEFDTYTITVPGAYDIASVCNDNPIVHRAGIDSMVELLLLPSVTHSLRVRVTDALNRPIPGAEVTLSRAGFSQTIFTNSCGQAFFNSGLGALEYTLEIEALPYIDATITEVVISGANTQQVTMLE